MTDLASHSSRTSSPITQPADAFDDYVAKALSVVLEQPHVTSYTLYVRDPITGDLCLHKAHNIRHRETIDGFILSRQQEQRRLLHDVPGRDEADLPYFPDAHLAALVGRDPLPPNIRARIRHIAETKGKGGHLYRSFVEREGIVSCFRIEHNETKADSLHTAILFVHFDARVDSKAPKLVKAIHDASDKLQHYLTEISVRLDRDYPSPLRRIVKILQPIQDLVAGRASTTATEFFQRLLTSVMRAMDISYDQGFGTIHLFHPTSGTLELCACTNEWMASLGKTVPSFKGEGVISWVALNRKPVLIRHMSTSDFKDLWIPHPEFETIESELAVPMVVGDEVVGVLNIEHVTPNVFTPQDAHTLWYAAAEAAVAYEFYNNMQRAQESEKRAAELLEITNAAVNLGTRDDELLHKLAKMLAKWVDVPFVEIWEFDDAKNAFCYAGANYPYFARDVLPRPNGASAFIVRHIQTVWMSSIQTDGTYCAEFWDSACNSWTASGPPCGTDALKMPQTVKSIVVKERTTGELGIPICAHERCIGVCWLKYNMADIPSPTAEKMALIIKLVGYVAIAVDAMRQVADREDKDFRDRVVKQYFAVGNLKAPGMTGHVLYEQCHGKVGGDFFVLLPGEERSWACLLGDVEGHGYEAALQMIPLINGFRIFHRKSDSPSYVLAQLAEANEKEVFGTALCFAYFEQEVFEEAERRRVRRFVKACSAGHPPLMVIHRNGTANGLAQLPTHNGPAQTQALGAGRFMSFGEECIEVNPGDLLIGYTDGVDEAGKKVRRDLFKRNQIESIAIAKVDAAPEVIARAIFDAAKVHSHNAFADDVTIVVVRIEE